MISSSRQHSEVVTFYKTVLNNFEHDKTPAPGLFVKVSSLTLLKIDSSTGVFL